MYTCAYCTVTACRGESREGMPQNCPMRQTGAMDAIFAEYAKPDNHDLFVASSHIEAEGYCVWPRLREVAEFAVRMGYKKLGLAFCIGLQSEAKTVSRILGAYGLEVVSVVCKTGGYSKEAAGIPKEAKLNPNQFESMCNPIAQARLLNGQNTDFNVVIGLCVGHDSLFYKHSDAPVTTLVTKDRALGHNPAAAIYCADTYFKKRLAPGE